MSPPDDPDRAEGRFTVTNELGLHFRAAAMVVRISSDFKSKITISNGKTQADAASVLDLMTLAASMGTSLTVIAEGSDADAAVSALGALIARNFAE
jgi:phosphotransferase system HPr (HPr) family protein